MYTLGAVNVGSYYQQLLPRLALKTPAEGSGDNRRVLPGKPDAIHSGALPVNPPAYGESTGEL